MEKGKMLYKRGRGQNQEPQTQSEREAENSQILDSERCRQLCFGQ